MLLDGFHARADGLHGCFQLICSDPALLGPIAQLVGLVHVETRAVLSAGFALVVSRTRRVCTGLGTIATSPAAADERAELIQAESYTGLRPPSPPMRHIPA